MQFSSAPLAILIGSLLRWMEKLLTVLEKVGLHESTTSYGGSEFSCIISQIHSSKPSFRSAIWYSGWTNKQCLVNFMAYVLMIIVFFLNQVPYLFAQWLLVTSCNYTTQAFHPKARLSTSDHEYWMTMS